MPVLEQIETKKMFDTSLREWMLMNFNYVQRYLDDKVNPSDHHNLISKFWEKPLLAKCIVKDYLMNNDEKYDNVLSLFAGKSVLATILGRRGGGKTATLLKFGEDLHKKHDKTVYFISSDMKLPNWIHQTLNPYDTEQGSVILYDEASLSLAARSAMSSMNIDMSAWLAITRHQNKTVLFASQHSGLIDLNIFRLSDVFLMKQLTFDDNLEREGARNLKEFLKFLMPNMPNETLFTDGSEWFSFKTELPSFWSENVSKTFTVLNKSDAIKYVKTAFEKGLPLKIISKNLRIRGINWSKEDCEFFAQVGKYDKTKSKR